MAAKSGPQMWRSKKDPKSGGEKWTPKVASKSGPQKWWWKKDPKSTNIYAPRSHKFMVSLDRVGPVDNRAFTNKLHQLNEYNKSLRFKNIYLWKKKIWHVKNDTWQVVIIVSIFQVPSFNGLGVVEFRRFGGKGWLALSINNKGVCRTALLHWVC